jgi:hypothetical protein
MNYKTFNFYLLLLIAKGKAIKRDCCLKKITGK